MNKQPPPPSAPAPAPGPAPSGDFWKTAAVHEVGTTARQSKAETILSALIVLLCFGILAGGAWSAVYFVKEVEPARETRLQDHEARVIEQIAKMQEVYLKDKSDLRAAHAEQLRSLERTFERAIDKMENLAARNEALLLRAAPRARPDE